MTFLCMLHRNKTLAHANLSSSVRQCKWPSLSRKSVKIQKFCLHGNVRSNFFSLYETMRLMRRSHCLSNKFDNNPEKTLGAKANESTKKSATG